MEIKKRLGAEKFPLIPQTYYSRYIILQLTEYLVTNKWWLHQVIISTNG